MKYTFVMSGCLKGAKDYSELNTVLAESEQDILDKYGWMDEDMEQKNVTIKDLIMACKTHGKIKFSTNSSGQTYFWCLTHIS